jgi:hypothetical protein
VNDSLSDIKNGGMKMNIIEKQKVLDVLNSLKVIESSGGEEAYALVENNEENRSFLNELGVTTETITGYGDEETFCILALAFSEGYANDYIDGKLVIVPDRYAVYDTATHDINFFDSYKQAHDEYAAAKEAILEDAVTGDETVYIFEVIKVANLIEDEDNKEDPTIHGFDTWVKWQDNE